MAAERKKQPKDQAPTPWLIHFFQRHVDVDPEQTVPGRAFLLDCPDKVRQTMLAVLEAVADAPPPAFSGGGMWAAMHGDMAGFYEVRVDVAKRRHYRLFCVLERDGEDVDLGGPSIVIITGKEKAFRTGWERPARSDEDSSHSECSPQHG